MKGTRTKKNNSRQFSSQNLVLVDNELKRDVIKSVSLSLYPTLDVLHNRSDKYMSVDRYRGYPYSINVHLPFSLIKYFTRNDLPTVYK